MLEEPIKYRTCLECGKKLYDLGPKGAGAGDDNDPNRIDDDAVNSKSTAASRTLDRLLDHYEAVHPREMRHRGLVRTKPQIDGSLRGAAPAPYDVRPERAELN